MRADVPSNPRLFRLICLAGACLALSIAPGASAETTHVVGPGHTLAKIAKRYHVSIEALRAANGLVPGQKLKPGQRVVIPDPGAAPEPPSRPSRGPEARASASRDEEYDSKRDDGVRGRSGADRYAGKPRHPGTVALVRGSQRWSGKTVVRGGKLAPAAADAFKRMLRDSSGTTHVIDPRLIQVVTQVSDHFGGRPIDIVSGFRVHTEGQYTAHSNHNVGKAIDFVVRGVPNEAVRDYCHTLQDTGVGYYPNSGFIHLDVRSASAQWVDESKPGDPPRYSSVTAGADVPRESATVRRAASAKGKSQAAAADEAEQ